MGKSGLEAEKDSLQVLKWSTPNSGHPNLEFRDISKISSEQRVSFLSHGFIHFWCRILLAWYLKFFGGV